MTIVPAALKYNQNTQVSVLAGVDRERYALRAHGYAGPFHMDTIVQKAGYTIDSKGEEVPVPFDAIEYHEQIMPSIMAYTQSLESGVQPFQVHIGPGNEAGTRGMILAMKALHMDTLPHPNATHGTPPQIMHLIDMMNVYQVSMADLERDYPALYQAYARHRGPQVMARMGATGAGNGVL